MVLRLRRGFTLIELLIVVVIIGILAAIAIPKFHNSKEQAYIAAMREDVRNLATAEEAYYADHSGSYAANTAALGTAYNASPGVTVTLVGTASNWRATARNPMTTVSCRLAAGTSTGSRGPGPCTGRCRRRCSTHRVGPLSSIAGSYRTTMWPTRSAAGGRRSGSCTRRGSVRDGSSALVALNGSPTSSIPARCVADNPGMS